jgi:hypothetical protein
MLRPPLARIMSFCGDCMVAGEFVNLIMSMFEALPNDSPTRGYIMMWLRKGSSCLSVTWQCCVGTCQRQPQLLVLFFTSFTIVNSRAQLSGSPWSGLSCLLVQLSSRTNHAAIPRQPLQRPLPKPGAYAGSIHCELFV